MFRSSAYPWTYLEAYVAGLGSMARFRDVQTYTMFIGQPRSGTSLVGSLLNAHRHICIANELNALRYIKRGYGRHQLYWLLLQRDAQFAREGRRWTGYDYAVPGQWQGRTECLRVIGDKKAAASSELLGSHPELLIRLEQVVRVPVRMIHVVRNPFDVIATTHRKRRRTPLSLAVGMYFSRSAATWQLMQKSPASVHTFRLEDLVQQPDTVISSLCRFLGVEPDRDYLSACRKKIFAQPRHSQHEIEWPSHLVDAVHQQMRAYPFLEGYGFQARQIERAA